MLEYICNLYFCHILIQRFVPGLRHLLDHELSQSPDFWHEFTYCVICGYRHGKENKEKFDNFHKEKK